MIVKRKLYSVMDEEGNLGYYLYNESTGEEKLFSVVEEEREFADLDEDDVKFLEEHARNKKRNSNNSKIKKLIATTAKTGLTLAAAEQIAKSSTKTGKFFKKHSLPITGAVVAANLADLYTAKKRLDKYNKLHDNFTELYVNSDKDTRKNLRELSRKERLMKVKDSVK